MRTLLTKRNIVFIIICISVLLPCTGFTSGERETANLEDQGSHEQELLWLQAEGEIIFTDIATKTMMNVDLTPGMVTVLIGKDLERRGVRNLVEALELVPGFLHSYLGRSMRGIGDWLFTSKIKYLINGKPYNRAITGDILPEFFPVEMIDRIEIIRGPGSVLYGKWAYTGVVNIVTHKDLTRLYSYVATFDTFKGGGSFSLSDSEKDYNLSLNFNINKNNPSGVELGPDLLHGTHLEAISQAPGPVNDRMKNIYGDVKFNYKGLYLSSYWVYNSSGSFYGLTGMLPEFDDLRHYDERIGLVEAGYENEFIDFLKSKVYIGYREQSGGWTDLQLMPPSPVYPDGMTMTNRNRIEHYYGGLEFLWEGWEDHKLLIAMESEIITSKDKDIWHIIPYDPVTLEPVSEPTKFTGDKNWLYEDFNRNIFSLVMEDQYAVTERLTLTGGMRYDKYNDIGGTLTSRFSAVFQVNNNHILKTQYAKAFRPPTFVEMYMQNTELRGDQSNDSEVVHTYEFEYLYTRNRFNSKLTLFFSEYKDLLGIADPYYSNVGDGLSKGAEFEVVWNMFKPLTLDANLSYVDTREDTTYGEIPGAATWLGNVTLKYNPIKDFYLNLYNRYVGERARAATDPRTPLEEYNTFDITLSVDNLLTKGFNIDAGCDNLFDEEVRYPDTLGGFKEDFLQMDRQLWVRLSYVF